MNGHEMLLFGISIVILGIFLGYAFHILSYVFSVRSEIDERLRRYAGVLER